MEFPHPFRGNENLKSRVATSESLRNFEKPSSGIFLQIHVVLLVILVHHLRLQLALTQALRVQLAEVAVELDELDHVLTEQSGGGESHQYLVLKWKQLSSAQINPNDLVEGSDKDPNCFT